jgi:hypothetical protein
MHHSSRSQTFNDIFNMLALRLLFNMKAFAEVAQRLFCSQDFILLSSFIKQLTSIEFILLSLSIQLYQRWIILHCELSVDG